MKDRSEYCILVRNGGGFVYPDLSMAFREGSRPAEFITKMSSPDVATAILTMFLVSPFIYLAFTGKTATDETKALGAALTTVLGFWFGRRAIQCLSLLDRNENQHRTFPAAGWTALRSFCGNLSALTWVGMSEMSERRQHAQDGVA